MVTQVFQPRSASLTTPSTTTLSLGWWTTEWSHTRFPRIHKARQGRQGMHSDFAALCLPPSPHPRPDRTPGHPYPPTHPPQWFLLIHTPFLPLPSSSSSHGMARSESSLLPDTHPLAHPTQSKHGAPSPPSHSSFRTSLLLLHRPDVVVHGRGARHRTHFSRRRRPSSLALCLGRRGLCTDRRTGGRIKEKGAVVQDRGVRPILGAKERERKRERNGGREGERAKEKRCGAAVGGGGGGRGGFSGWMFPALRRQPKKTTTEHMYANPSYIAV